MLTDQQAIELWYDKQFDEYGWLQPWLWPRRVFIDPRWNHRLGRVVHWCFTLAAIATVIGGAFIQYDERNRRAEDVEAARKWDYNHTLRPPVNYPIGHAPAVADPAPDFSDTERPYVPDKNSTPLWVGAGFAFALLLLGRGFRYIVGGE